MKESNKSIIIITIIVIMILTMIYSILLDSKDVILKTYNIESITNLINKGYDNVREMDFIDMTTLFGTEFEKNDNMLFLTNMQDVNNIDTKSMILVVMNTDEVESNYDILQSFLDSYKLNTDDKELLDYYDTAILKKGENYVFFILAEDPTMMEREINSFYY